MTKVLFDANTVGEVVAHDFRAASIFKNAGIDFCCGGNKSLHQACIEKGINATNLEKELNELNQLPINESQRFNEWNLDFLCDYIVNTHHKFVIKTLPELVFYTQKIAKVHGSNHPELAEVAILFGKINEELTQHLQNEEDVLFPAIKVAIKGSVPAANKIIISEITRMRGEHEVAGSAIDRISELTQKYLVPADACNTYQVALKLLEQFDNDLHIHVHLENNILYPKAFELAN